MSTEETTQPPHHDRGEVERQARDLLAKAYRDGGFPYAASVLLEGRTDSLDECALAALTAALTEAKQQGATQSELAAEYTRGRCDGWDAAKQQGPGEAVKWWNGCDTTVPKALRYLADNPRPEGGERTFNSLHLYQLADEIEMMARKRLYEAPQVEAKRQTGEGESPSLKRIIPAAHPYPKPDQVTGADTGSIGEHAYADGWNDCRKAMIAAAAKPSGDKV